MSVYVIGLVTIKDRTKYAIYEQEFREVFDPFGGRILAVEDAARVVEGTWPATRTVLLQFPDEAIARRWYSSEPYQKLIRLRADAAEASIAILSGLPAI